ncbi:putative membrane protein [Auxenochlorella protothecoides]|uniref:Putative membrane protein n=1 Tax=Auxenochlorella protothecoides TaxID=3075 RepID=A0A087SME9_AUXPR|nr:putative membrane protein [Auxenochlorella protothecoides]KFM26903.1 putative membrane protein [Auxenochlorella protothecoides]
MDIEQLKQIEEAEPDKKALNVFLAIAAALLFGLGIWGVQGPNKAAEYFAGYLLEQSLSIDNLFVFVLVFEYFKTPRKAQDVVLTYGIASAAVLRLVLIGAGSSIIGRFKPLLVVFAAILMVSSFKLLTPRMTLSTNYDGTNFFTVENGVKMATPLLLVLLVVELTDVVFAVDSIPAVFGVTLDPFIIYTSNIFAILSLRSVYAFVATILGELKYLDKAIAAVLGFIGCKILAEFAGLEISTAASLLVVVGLLDVYQPSPLPETPTLTVPEGRGSKLRDIPNVNFKLGKITGRDELTEHLHNVLYRRKGAAAQRKKAVLDFSGFVFDDASRAAKKRAAASKKREREAQVG